MKPKYKAKPISKITQFHLSYLDIPVDEDGYVYGWYADGFIVGNVVEATDEYINFESWIPVNVSTVELLEVEG